MRDHSHFGRGGGPESGHRRHRSDEWAAGKFGEGFGRGRGGGRRGRLFDNGELRLLLLDLFAQGPRHGYELIREIEMLSNGIYVPSPGMVYPALTMMAEMGHIAEQPGEGARKLYAITDEGQEWLAARAEGSSELLQRLSGLAKHAGPGHAPVRRAMENLKASLRIRLGREGADEQTILDVASLIDEAAAKIERLK